MAAVDMVLFKTRHAEERLAGAARNSVFVGFTSEDRRRPGVAKNWDGMVHVAGWNPYKGTAAIVDAWQQHPAWPSLPVVAQLPLDSHPPNLALLKQRIPDEQLLELQNRAALHLCPSEAEGFGHSINEARSCGAAVLTVNAPPMNELVTEEYGVLVPYGSSEPKAFGTRFKVTAAALANGVEQWLATSQSVRQRMGEAARAAFEDQDRSFRRQLLTIVAES
jgi:glycosyltransferase involved in cell wall biosynthesis